MSALISFYQPLPAGFYPFSLTMELQTMQTGIYNAQERWEQMASLYAHVSPYRIHPGWVANLGQMKEVLEHPEIHFINDQEQWIAGPENGEKRQISSVLLLHHPLDLIHKSGGILEIDIELHNNSSEAQKSYRQIEPEKFPGVTFVRPERIYLQPGVQLSAGVVLNAENGYILLSAGVQIMELSALRGPVVIGKNSVVKMGSTLYGPIITEAKTILGGEIKAAWIGFGTNKSHFGYLGDSVLGRWCNLGAGTSNSNVKNNAGKVLLWNEALQRFSSAGLKAGMLMGSHTRTAIQTSINTGTVIGPVCNIFGPGKIPAHLPGFQWGVPSIPYEFTRALEHIKNWMNFKNETLTQSEEEQLKLLSETINTKP